MANLKKCDQIIGSIIEDINKIVKDEISRSVKHDAKITVFNVEKVLQRILEKFKVSKSHIEDSWRKIYGTPTILVEELGRLDPLKAAKAAFVIVEPLRIQAEQSRKEYEQAVRDYEISIRSC